MWRSVLTAVGVCFVLTLLSLQLVFWAKGLCALCDCVSCWTTSSEPAQHIGVIVNHIQLPEFCFVFWGLLFFRVFLSHLSHSISHLYTSIRPKSGKKKSFGGGFMVSEFLTYCKIIKKCWWLILQSGVYVNFVCPIKACFVLWRCHSCVRRRTSPAECVARDWPHS